jgi:putative membrane protein
MRYLDGWHHGIRWGAVVLVLFLLVALGILFWLAIAAGRNRSGATRPAPGAVEPTRSRAEDILRERLARGEIDTEDFTHRLNALRSTSAPPPPG